MNILAIETSCDETSIAFITHKANRKKITVHGYKTHSQIEQHQEYGGVFPSLAKREHAKNLIPVFADVIQTHSSSSRTISHEKKQKIKQTLSREPDMLDLFLKHIGSRTNPNIDLIAVTYGPGLEPALWTGINFAKALNILWDIPVLPINHLEGHVASLLLNTQHFTHTPSYTGEYTYTDIPLPSIGCIVSGGHTELVRITDWGTYEHIGSTRDDAVGEAFDKTARLLELPYPGGPELSRLAHRARENHIAPVHFKRPMIHSGDYTFSFSGIKTAVRYYIDALQSVTQKDRMAIARGFEESVTDVLIAKAHTALTEYHINHLILTGGVSANNYLRNTLLTELSEHTIHLSPKSLAGDNALMIACAALSTYQKDPNRVYTDPSNIEAIGNLSLGETAITKQERKKT